MNMGTSFDKGVVAVTHVLVRSSSLRDGLPDFLKAVCENLNWDIGLLWMIDKPRRLLRCEAVWQDPAVQAETCVAVSQQRTFEEGVGLAGQVWASGKPTWIRDLSQDANFARTLVAQKVGLQSACGCPILLGSEVLGTIEFFSKEIREPDADLLDIMSALASQLGEFVESRRRSEQASRFLSETCAALAGPLDHESMLLRLACLAVPQFADACAIETEPDGYLRRVAVAHVHSSTGMLSKLSHYYPASNDIRLTSRTGESQLYPEVNDAVLAEIIPCEQLLQIMRELGARSCLSVPLKAQGKTLGTLTMVTGESSRRFDAKDLALSEDFAGRAALAIENARLGSEVREARRRKEQFLTMLAHELRNPLASLRNVVHIMRQPNVDGFMMDHVRKLTERQVEQLTRMVDDLLDVSCLTSGKMEILKEVVDLASVLSRAVESLRPLIDDRRLKLTVAVSPELPLLEGDPNRLEQVLAHLLKNAAGYTHGGGHIWLTARQEQQQIVLRVTDTGIGIPANMLSRIFEPFVQSDQVQQQSRQGGLGIGLTLVRGLVEKHGGRVEAHSEGPGQGSEFVVRLPALAGRPSRPAAPNKATRLATLIPKRRILVVDDNADAAESLALLLRMEPHEVEVAHDGPAALAAVDADPPDLIFLDIGMPVMNGYEVAQRLRQRPGLEKVQLVAMTGWGQEEDRRRSQEAGFDHHLIKPAEPSALRRLLARSERLA
jgi:signal transduction histidine kinase/ActR/RegA family two-component response regulator